MNNSKQNDNMESNNAIEWINKNINWEQHATTVYNDKGMYNLIFSDGTMLLDENNWAKSITINDDLFYIEPSSGESKILTSSGKELKKYKGYTIKEAFKEKGCYCLHKDSNIIVLNDQFDEIYNKRMKVGETLNNIKFSGNSKCYLQIEIEYKAQSDEKSYYKYTLLLNGKEIEVPNKEYVKIIDNDIVQYKNEKVMYYDGTKEIELVSEGGIGGEVIGHSIGIYDYITYRAYNKGIQVFDKKGQIIVDGNDILHYME